jgi:hypothetical protein
MPKLQGEAMKARGKELQGMRRKFLQELAQNPDASVKDFSTYYNLNYATVYSWKLKQLKQKANIAKEELEPSQEETIQETPQPTMPPEPEALIIDQFESLVTQLIQDYKAKDKELKRWRIIAGRLNFELQRISQEGKQ